MTSEPVDRPASCEIKSGVSGKGNSVTTANVERHLRHVCHDAVQPRHAARSVQQRGAAAAIAGGQATLQGGDGGSRGEFLVFRQDEVAGSLEAD
jgi:hypothetical protein